MIQQEELWHAEAIQRRAALIVASLRERAAYEPIEPGPLTLDGDLVVDADPHRQAVAAALAGRYSRFPLIFFRCLLLRWGIGPRVRTAPPLPAVDD